MKLLFINPYQQQSSGVRTKVDAQVEALRDAGTVRELGLTPPGLPTAGRHVRRLANEARAIALLTTHSAAYFRYSPVCILFCLSLPAMSLFRTVFVEYNTVYGEELRSRWLMVWCHRLAMACLRRSRVHHLPVTGEIGRLERLPKGFRVLGNGYASSTGPRAEKPGPASSADPLGCASHHGLGSPASQGVGDGATATILRHRQRGQYVLIFTASAPYDWNGLDRALKLLDASRNLSLVVAGPDLLGNLAIPAALSSRIIDAGALAPARLAGLYRHANAGLGPLAIDRKGLTEACPLKVRDYLSHGLPTIVNYHDPLLDEDWCRPSILRLDAGAPSDIQEFLSRNIDRRALAATAGDRLSWGRIFRDAGVLPTAT